MPADDQQAQVPVAFELTIGGAQSAGVFKEATGFDSESEVSEVKRSLPNGLTLVSKAMGDAKWGASNSSAGSTATGPYGASSSSTGGSRKLARTVRSRCSTPKGRPLITYSIINAWPRKYTGAGFKADSDEVAVEGLTLCHDGFDVKDPAPAAKPGPVAAPAPRPFPVPAPGPTPTAKRRPDRRPSRRRA
jgi:phage tail-like protein